MPRYISGFFPRIRILRQYAHWCTNVSSIHSNPLTRQWRAWEQPLHCVEDVISLSSWRAIVTASTTNIAFMEWVQGARRWGDKQRRAVLHLPCSGYKNAGAHATLYNIAHMPIPRKTRESADAFLALLHVLPEKFGHAAIHDACHVSPSLGSRSGKHNSYRLLVCKVAGR